MKRFIPGPRPPAGATLADVVRLAGTLRGEMGRRIRVEVDFSHPEVEIPSAIVQIIEDREIDQSGHWVPHVWAQRIITSHAYSISFNTLFDLLIVAYKEVERDQGDGDA